MSSGGQGSLTVLIVVSERFDEPVELYREYRAALDPVAPRARFVYVLDGPFEDVERELRGLIDGGEPVRVVRLGRSFGEATALQAGFREVDTDWVLTLPAYHQIEAQALPRLFARREEADLVVCRRWPRRDSRLNRLQTALFHRLLGLAAGTGFRDLGCSVRLMRRQVLEEVRLYGDQHRFLPLLAQRQGFRVIEADLPQSERDHYHRFYRPGVYLRRLLDMLTVFFLVKFTKKPLRFFGLIGSAFIALGGLWFALLLAQRIFQGIPLADRPALLVSAFAVVLGVQVFSLGLLGELVIFTHARKLKEYTVAEIIGD